LVARDLHRQSSRAEEVFMSVDMGALSETLFESELFGHVKGAFTDAREDRAGKKGDDCDVIYQEITLTYFSFSVF